MFSGADITLLSSVPTSAAALKFVTFFAFTLLRTEVITKQIGPNFETGP